MPLIPSARDGCALTEEDLLVVPFAKVVLPVALDAVSQMRSIELYAQLDARVQAACERHLLERLGRLASYSLYFEFSLFRHARGHASGLFARAGGDELYCEFVAHMQRGGFQSFIKEYPALAAGLTTVSQQWCKNTRELLERLAQDCDILAPFLGSEHTLGRLCHLELSLSEPHNQGRSVARLQFESGHCAYYKPRNCCCDVNYAALVAWLAERGAGLRAARVLDRETYGWFEAISKEECATDREVSRYYEKSGELLCLLYALRATDNHCENVIATADGPVLIDTECLMHPGLAEIFSHNQVVASSPMAKMESVYSTHFIPSPPDPEQPSLMPDLSALGCTDLSDFKPPFALPVVVRPNTDDMALELPEVITQQAMISLNSQVWCAGQLQEYTNFAGELVRGFRSMYNLLLEHRQELLCERSPLSRFALQPVRVVARPTVVYVLLLIMASRSNLMRTPGESSKFLTEFLNSLTGDDALSLDQIIRQEVESMALDLDVPYFSMPASQRQLVDGFNLEASCFDMMQTRMQSLSPVDLQTQLDYLKLVL